MVGRDDLDAARDAPVSAFWLEGRLVLPALNRIRTGEEIVSVEPRVMAVLVRLASRPGEVLSREHLFATVWPDAVVCEEALTRTISELRRLFGDEARSPRIIETIRKGGYRLVAPVTPAAEPELPRLCRPGGRPPAEPPPPAIRPDRPFTVADWNVEPVSGRLTRNGDAVRLEPRVMQVLVCLASRPGQVVPREAILEAVWPRGEIREATLRGAIADLRRVFEDPADAPRYVETIRGTGYRLVAPVRQPLAGPVAGWPGRAPGAWWLAAALTVSVGVAILLRGASPDRAVAAWRVRPLTAYPGREHTPALSPDGSMVAFSWRGDDPDEDGLLDLYVLRVDDASPVRLTAEAGHEIYPTWSPDGTRIAYASGLSDSFAIRTVSVLGTKGRTLAAVGSPVAGLDWSPDGDLLAFSARDEPGAPFRIRLLDLQNLRTVPLDVPQLPGDHVLPAFSPDGTTLAFLREENYNDQKVLVTSLGSGVAEELAGPGQRVAGVDWISDHELVLSSSDLVEFDLWLADLETGRHLWLTALGGPAVSPTVARDGSRLVFGKLAYDCNIRSVDLGTEGQVRAEEEPLVASTRLDYQPVCSPDGRSIAFLSDRSGHVELWIADAGGGNPRPVTQEVGTYLMNPCWSPDSRRLAFSAMSDGQLAVFVSDVDGGIARRLSDADDPEVLLLWSSSGEWLYYRVQRDDGAELWRRRPDRGDGKRLTETGSTILAEVAGGDLLCRQDAVPGIWRMRASGGEARLVVPGDIARDWTGVAAAEKGLYFIRRGVTDSCLGFYDWATAREDSLAAVPLDSGMLTISPDGTRLLYDCTTEFELDLMLAEVTR